MMTTTGNNQRYRFVQKNNIKKLTHCNFLIIFQYSMTNIKG